MTLAGRIPLAVAQQPGTVGLEVSLADLSYRPIAAEDLAGSSPPGGWVAPGSDVGSPSSLADQLEAYSEGDTASGHWLQAVIETMDPIAIALTRTTVSVAWADCPIEPEFLYGGGSCWAANPSILGTHWFVQSCYPGPDDGLLLSKDISATYFNDDFLSNSLRTWVDVFARLHGGSVSSPVLDVFHTASGEAASFLSYRVYFNSGFETGTCSAGNPGGNGGNDDDGTNGGGDSNPPPGGGGGTTTCLPVYNDDTGEYLGECCGETTLEIVECALGFP
ncbi:MAG: hypothetical protein KDD47_25370 [Acidobacteria bacterium]|nr:hypothetical protein [Acidobacteriota bacterium]